MKQCILMSKKELDQAIINYAATEGITLSVGFEVTHATNGGVSINTGAEVVTHLELDDETTEKVIAATNKTTDKPPIKETPKRVRRSKEQIAAGMTVEEVGSGMTLEEFLANKEKKEPAKEGTVGAIVEGDDPDNLPTGASKEPDLAETADDPFGEDTNTEPIEDGEGNSSDEDSLFG